MRVLIVDDEVRLTETLRRGLTLEGFVTETAHDGNEAFWLAQNHEFDVILLDLMIPGLNGYDVCRNLRAAGNWTPILVLTAKDGPYDQVDAFDLGADDYLIKPFSFMVLVARIRALGRRIAPERPVVLTVGSMSLDPGTREVNKDGKLVALTPREFGLLHYFMRHVDVAVSKRDILDNVWDFAYEGDDNIVEVYVSYLRRKLAMDSGVGSILTVRGFGYRLLANA